MFIDGGAAIMIILAPLLIPAALKLGIDPLHLGIVMVVNIMIVSNSSIWLNDVSNMFIIKYKIRRIYERNNTFIVALLLVLFILTYIPDIVLFLPNLLS